MIPTTSSTNAAALALEVDIRRIARLYAEHGFFKTPEGKNANEGRVEWRIAPRSSLEAAFGDAGAGGLDLFWTHWS